MSEQYRQLAFEGWELPKQEHETLDVFIICKEHQAMIYQTPVGFFCCEGNEQITDESQICETIGRFIPTDCETLTIDYDRRG